MKQHITVEQLNEAHLLDTLIFATIFEIGCNDYETDEELDKKVAEKITIGEMIDILMKNNCNEYPVFETNVEGQIRVRCNNDTTLWSDYHDELIDSLWEVVKKVL